MPDLFGQPDPAHAPTLSPGDRFALVAVHRGLEHAGRARGGAGHDAALTYRLPEPLVPAASIGQLVTVPLGKTGKPVTGVIVEIGGSELLGELSPARVKPVVELAPAVIPPALLGLGRWIAQYYVCPLGMVLLAVMPAAVKKQTGAKAVSVLTLVEPPPAPVQPLTRRLEHKLAEIRSLDAGAWPMTARALCSLVPGLGAASVRALLSAGVLHAHTQPQVSAKADPILAEAMAGPSAPAAAPALTPDQARVVGAVAPALDRFGVHLIRGVTGSGKTEVYLRLLARVLESDPRAGAIVLVPEIALTPQTARRFLDRFGHGAVAVLHSALSEAQRHVQWQAAARGQVRVVVGARSAIFAPLPRLRLVIVDEEHDSSYKQDQLPRYHARDAAVKRAQIEGCPVLLGSATPSLESWANARTHAGTHAKYTLHELPARATGAPLPEVRVVDLMDERRLRAALRDDAPRDRLLHLIGPTLGDAIDRTLTQNGQIILLLNRRGFASYLCCPDPRCGFVMRCEHCDATVVYHRGEHYASGGSAGFVRCHHCLAEVLLPQACPQCKVKKLNVFGLGTQRVEEELARTFAHHGLVPGESLVRIDGDTMRTARDYFRVLDGFSRGHARVLLGTQMIAKGLDYPNVQLVGVVSADTALTLPDFRAAERTFQLVSQVAGRAGRADKPGLVIVQTASPGAPSIVHAAHHDYVAFADEELALRTRAGLPPAARMARVVCRDTDLAKANSAARALALSLREAIDRHPRGAISLRGPMPCAVARIDDHHRIALELTATTRGIIQSVLGAVRSAGLLTSDAHTAVDVDPIALL